MLRTDNAGLLCLDRFDYNSVNLISSEYLTIKPEYPCLPLGAFKNGSFTWGNCLIVRSCFFCRVDACRCGGAWRRWARQRKKNYIYPLLPFLLLTSGRSSVIIVSLRTRVQIPPSPPDVHRNFDRITVGFFYARKSLETVWNKSFKLFQHRRDPLRRISAHFPWQRRSSEIWMASAIN